MAFYKWNVLLDASPTDGSYHHTVHPVNSNMYKSGTKANEKENSKADITVF